MYICILENQDYLFPVLALNQNITRSIKKIISADISRAIHSGLNNEIKYTDLNCSIHTPAEIVKDSSNEKWIVKLSASYCQYFWLISDVILKWVDYHIMDELCNSYGISMLDLSRQFEDAINHFPNTIQQAYGREFTEQYLGFAKSVKDFIIDPQFIEKIVGEFFLAIKLTTCQDRINIEDYYQYEINSPYEQRVNAVYCYGIAFILLHEAAHFQLGHLSTTENRQQEIEADESAIWSIINDLDGQERFTAVCGTILMFFSLMLLNPSLEEDSVHSREDIRLFSVYDKFKEENEKYRLLIIGLFNLWGKNDPDFPKNISNSDESVIEIRNYLNEKYTHDYDMN